MREEEGYLSVSQVAKYDYEVKKSLFHALLFPVRTLEEGKAVLEKARADYPDATHCCYAFRGVPEVGESRLGDDKEPSGTAGQPIYNVLVKRELYGVTLAVIRYFGGIKLGASGLSNAYTQAAAGVVASAQIVSVVRALRCALTLTYPVWRALEGELDALGAEVEKREYHENVFVEIALPAKNEGALFAVVGRLTRGGAPKKIEYTLRAFSSERR